MKYFCNPINLSYRYQFNADQRKNKIAICREAADPSMICYKGVYYLFASMNLCVWSSRDLVHWEKHSLPDNLPLYDYAPDVRVLGDYVYFSASKKGEPCNFYRTKDVIAGPYEEIKGCFDFWDPNLFVDDDQRVYFYWGCSNETPLWGVELDAQTMQPIGEKVALVASNPYEKGFERIGENNSKFPRTQEEVEMAFQGFLKMQNKKEEDLPAMYIPMIKGMFSDKPYIEGPWMDKKNGLYYLQYAFAGTQYNTYGDGVYVGKSPLGPFELAKNNPYSYKPGGFIPGAGHGSTMETPDGRLWHTSTMRISKNHDFERRIGLFPAQFDEDGELCCNQRYADWPMKASTEDIWEEPDWYLLSYGKKVTASSQQENHQPDLVADENVQTWWKPCSNSTSEWLQMDLGKAYMVHGIQINFADDGIDIPVPGKIRGTTQARYIEERQLQTNWLLEGSVDGETFFVIEDKTKTQTDLPHDFIVREEGLSLRYLRCSKMQVPYEQTPAISGFRVFGKGDGEKPAIPEAEAVRTSELDFKVVIQNMHEDTVGYNILWGHSKEKLYHSCMTFEKEQRIGALVSGEKYYVRVDAFNENGITNGKVVELEWQ